MIRLATLDDIPEIARLGAVFHEQAGWVEIPYIEADCAASLSAFMDMPNFISLVSDDGGINGMISGITSPVYFNHAHTSGEELFWWVDETAPQMVGVKLLKALENEAKSRGVATWQMKSLARLGGERMVKLYERLGYRASERTFIKELV